MTFETEERGQPLLRERPRLLAVRTRAVADNDQTTADPGTDSVRAREPAPQEWLRGKRLLVDFLPGYEDKPAEHHWKTVDELHRRLRQQDALVGAIALLLLAVAVVALSYVCWDGGRHFESTDDAFIARRQFPMVAHAILAS
jgi:hypothetical protein